MGAVGQSAASWRIAVGGAGGIGSLLGGCLSRAGADVWLVGPWREHIEAMRTEGLRLEEPGGVSTVPVRALHASEAERLRGVDVLLVGVKSYDTAWIVSLLRPCLSPGAVVVSCQNGVNEDVIASLVGRDATAGCVVHLGATLLGPGHVRRNRPGGRLTLGEHAGPVTERVERLAGLLSACAETRVTPDLRGARWAKLAENAIGNPLLALTGYTVGELHARPGASLLRRAVVAELVRVARGAGDSVGPILGLSPETWTAPLSARAEAIDAALAENARLLARTRSSMSYDLERGRRLEIDALNGHVVRKGSELGLATPVNAAVVSMIGELEAGRLRAGPENLDALVGALAGNG